MTDGFLLADKPAGITSHDVVARVRRAVGRGVRVGHAGTLDPFATGLLIVLLGRATRVQRFVLELEKTYAVEARFGAVSTTGDRDGTIAETGVVPRGALTLPTGELMQTPPAYSAVKVGGRRAYALARAGEEVVLAPRPVVVHRFEETARSPNGAERSFVVRCSSGTYIRSLIMELGDAYCTALRRTAIGPFDVAEASQPPEGRGALDVVPLGEALGRWLPAVTLGDRDAVAAGHGRAVAATADGAPVGAPVVRLLDRAGELIALAEPREGGQLKPIVGFRA